MTTKMFFKNLLIEILYIYIYIYIRKYEIKLVILWGDDRERFICQKL